MLVTAVDADDLLLPASGTLRDSSQPACRMAGTARCSVRPQPRPNGVAAGGLPKLLCSSGKIALKLFHPASQSSLVGQVLNRHPVTCSVTLYWLCSFLCHCPLPMLPQVTSQLNHLHLDSCLKDCFWRNPAQDIWQGRCVGIF